APKFKWGAAVFPKGPNGKHTVNVGSSAHAIPAKGTQPDAAWKWLSFLAGDESMSVWAKNGNVPPRKSATPTVVEAFKLSENFKKVFIDAGDAYGVPVWEHEKRAQVEKAFDDEFQLVWLGQRDVEDAARAAKVKVDALLKAP